MTKQELLKTAKPILFNTDMVRAVLDGRKTETRRALKVHYKDDEIGFNIVTNAHTGEFVKVTKYDEWENTYDDYGRERIVNPPYSPGDILYVRETWNYGYFDSSDFEYTANECWFEELPRGTKTSLGDGRYVYRAELSEDELDELEYKNEDGYRGISWHPSIHMPKEAARIFLRVTDVRVERVQDISGGDLIKEGIDLYQSNYVRVAFKEFADLWDSTIPKKDRDEYGWDANPFVWVIEFERVEVEA